MNADDGWIVARRLLSDLPLGQRLPATVVVTDGGRPPLSANKTLMLMIGDDGCVASAAAAGGTNDGRRFAAAIISTVVVLMLAIVLAVILLLVKFRRKPDGGGRVLKERRWTEADGAEELTAKQRLNTGSSTEKSSTLYCRLAAWRVVNSVSLINDVNVGPSRY